MVMFMGLNSDNAWSQSKVVLLINVVFCLVCEEKQKQKCTIKIKQKSLWAKLNPPPPPIQKCLII